MRNKIILRGKDAVYYTVSRSAFQEHKFDATARSVFRELLRKQAEFSGVEVYAYCFLQNHFHILLKIPFHSEIPDAEIVRRYRVLYSDKSSPYALSAESVEKLLKENTQEGKELRSRLLARMGDLSIFMKELKQRYSIWFNATHGTEGTLWSDRFASVLVEDNKEVIEYLAAYIDMNPIRVRSCEDVVSYGHNTSSSAISGHDFSRKCIQRLYPDDSSENALMKYTTFLQSMIDPTTQDEPPIPKIHRSKVIGSPGFVAHWKSEQTQNLKQKSKLSEKIISGALMTVIALLEPPRAQYRGKYQSELLWEELQEVWSQ